LNIQQDAEVVVSCPPGQARVVAVSPRHVTVTWPWGEPDHSAGYRWDGTFALPYGEARTEWVPYRVEPDPAGLRVGDVCTVSIPPTRLVVGFYEEYDEPRNLGWTPAPTAGISVMPEHGLDEEYDGCVLYLGGAMPITVEPVDLG